MHVFRKINRSLIKPQTCPYSTNEFRQRTRYSCWLKLLSQAEYILGDKSFKNIKWLMSEEISYLAIHAQNMENIQHPVADVARSIAYNEGISWGLIVMLLSKCAGKYTGGLNSNVIDDLWQNQYTIARVTQMLNMAVRIHESVCNKCSISSAENYGNKIAILCGDYFLAKCLNELATLQDFYTVELMSSAMRDLTIAQHLGPRDNDNKPYPSKPNDLQADVSSIDTFSVEPIQIYNSLGNSEAEWILRATLGGGSLLGKGCSSVFRLAGYPKAYQNIAYTFGKYFSLAYQALNDVKHVCSEATNFSLISLPVLLHLRNDPYLYNELEKNRENGDEIDYDLIRKSILNGNAILEANKIRKQFLNGACSILDTFESNDAQNLLKDITQNMETESLRDDI